MSLRKEDKDDPEIEDFVRSARFVETEEGWYFKTREGILLGPYEEKFDAEISASLLVARLAQLEEGKDPAAVIQAFEHDPANATKRNVGRPHQADLDAIRRKHQLNPALPTFHKAWNAISRLKTVSRLAKAPR